jgi:type IV secretion system protein VirB9
MKFVRPATATTSLFFVAALTVCHPVFAEKQPRGLPTDNRIRTLTYNENEVYRITANYGYMVNIEFGADENIETVSAGDTISWQFVPTGRRLFVKPVLNDAQTNLTVVTSKRVYTFDLNAKSPEKDAKWKLTYLVRFAYPGQDTVQVGGGRSPTTAGGAPGTAAIRVAGTNRARTATDFNFQYKIVPGKNGEEISPTFVFDDGEFTFFQFADKRKKELPAIFLVDNDSNESVVNYRVEGNYMVVERLGSRYTLRSGEGVVCVTNLLNPPKKQEVEVNTN